MEIKPFFKFKLGDVLMTKTCRTFNLKVKLLDQIGNVYVIDSPDRLGIRYGRNDIETCCILQPKLVSILYGL